MSISPSPAAQELLSKTSKGKFFEDLVGYFERGEIIYHSTPREISGGDIAVYNAAFGAQFGPQSSHDFAELIGYTGKPVDALLLFHMGFGKTVPDISYNAVVNLGYAEGKFYKPVYAGETVVAETEIIGYKENVDKETGDLQGHGNIYVKSIIYKWDAGKKEPILEYCRWVRVNKRDKTSPALTNSFIPKLAAVVKPEDLCQSYPALDIANYNTSLAGSPHGWEQFRVGERIDHSFSHVVAHDHHMLPNLFQNTARVHFDDPQVVYGGHVMSLARRLSFNGLQNAIDIVGINAGHHTNPTYAGDVISAWSEVLDVQEIKGRSDIGLLRIRTVAAKNMSTADFPDKSSDGKYHLKPMDMNINGMPVVGAKGVVLNYDYWVIMPRGLSSDLAPRPALAKTAQS